MSKQAHPLDFVFDVQDRITRAYEKQVMAEFSHCEPAQRQTLLRELTMLPMVLRTRIAKLYNLERDLPPLPDEEWEDKVVNFPSRG